jgi:hypothetical protein
LVHGGGSRWVKTGRYATFRVGDVGVYAFKISAYGLQAAQQSGVFSHLPPAGASQSSRPHAASLLKCGSTFNV